MNEYDGWVIKYSWGQIEPSTFREKRTAVIKAWDKQAYDGIKWIPELMWKNMGKRLGHKIVKVKLMEIRKAEDA